MKILNEAGLDWLKAIAYIASLVLGAVALPFVAAGLAIIIRYVWPHLYVVDPDSFMGQ